MSYEKRWDQSAATPEEALIAVDGSGSEEILRRTGQWTAKQLRAALDIQATDTVLELGCGVGRIGRELIEHCAEWHGADIAGNMLTVARRRLSNYPNAHFHKLDRTALASIPDNSIDKAYSVAVLIHIDKEDVFLYLRELQRVLRAGGRLYVEGWNLADPVGWKRWMLEVTRWDDADQSERKDVSRNQFSTAVEYRLYLEAAGLTEITLFDDSPWLQVLAAKSPDPASLEAWREAAAEHAAEIRYSERFSALFGEVIDLFTGNIEHAALLSKLKERDDAESVLFRAWLQVQ